MVTSYQDATDYLYSALPMYQRIGKAALKNDLTNTLQLCEALGHPERTFKSIHVAGTNGKGSSSHMLAAILQCAGYNTGLYTSPHLKSFTERIRINGQEVSQAFVVDFVNRMEATLDKIKPSFFEMTVGMAFDCFRRNLVEMAVVEVGLGGRLDSTNVITPEICLITNISFDHKDLLGDTLQKIAGEKAGIIKPGIPVIISERQPEVETVFLESATRNQSSLQFASDHFALENKNGAVTIRHKDQVWLSGLQPELKGEYQNKNICGVAGVVHTLREMGYAISDQAVTQGIEQAASLTGLKGRWQKLSELPLVIADTGHNEQGIREVLNQITRTPHKHLHAVFGMVNDKESGAILAMLPKTASYYFCQAKIPRALDAHELASRAAQAGLQGSVVPDVNEALAEARRKAGKDDMIWVGGSTFVVAEVEGL